MQRAQQFSAALKRLHTQGKLAEIQQRWEQ